MYTVMELARLTGLTPRTLRYYDSIGLLRPGRGRENGYRLYDSGEVDRLQQILLYREMGLPLEEIRSILDGPDLDLAAALRAHLTRLLERRREVDALIRTVRKTLDAMQGGTTMNDREKFTGMKRQAVEENEAAYGREVRERYGGEALERHNARLMDMSEEEWTRMKGEESGYLEALRRAAASGDPEGADAVEAVKLHAAWLAHYWPQGAVTARSHAQMAEMYVADERFAAYYEKVAPGAAAFLARAIKAYYREDVS